MWLDVVFNYYDPHMFVFINLKSANRFYCVRDYLLEFENINHSENYEWNKNLLLRLSNNVLRANGDISRLKCRMISEIRIW